MGKRGVPLGEKKRICDRLVDGIKERPIIQLDGSRPCMFTPKQLVLYLGEGTISLSSLNKSRMTGSANRGLYPPYVVVGGSIFYIKADVDEWLAGLARNAGCVAGKGRPRKAEAPATGTV